MAQTDFMAGATTAGFVRGLTLGAVKGDIEYEPIQRAAAEYLSSTRGPGCALSNSRKLTHVGGNGIFIAPGDVQTSLA